MFETRSDWYSHEMQFHRKQWSCNEAGHPVYQQRAEFECHLQEEHQSWVMRRQLEAVIDVHERPIASNSKVLCPLCTDDQIEEGEEPRIRRDPKFVLAAKMKHHLGCHLERLALFAVSPSLDLPDEEGSAQSDEVATGGSRSLDEDSVPESSESIDGSSLELGKLV